MLSGLASNMALICIIMGKLCVMKGLDGKEKLCTKANTVV